MNNALIHIAVGTALALAQGLLFNNVHWEGYFTPFPYIYLLITLPVNLGRVPMLLIGFAYGLGMDVLADTGGLHTAASVLLAFVRPLLLNAVSPRDGYEVNVSPHIGLYGIGWFASYAISLTLLHHATLFIFEVFRFSGLLFTLLRVLTASAATLALVFAFELLFTRQPKR